MSNLKHSEVVHEVNTFPNSAKVDAIDALANMEFVLLENYSNIIIRNPVQKMQELYWKAEQLQLGYENEMTKAQEEEFALRNKLKKEMDSRYF